MCVSVNICETCEHFNPLKLICLKGYRQVQKCSLYDPFRYYHYKNDVKR